MQHTSYYFFYFHFHLKHNTTQHATGRNNKQGANYRLQTKQNNGLTNIKSKLLQQTPGNKKQVDDAPCEVEEYYEIKEILIEYCNRFYYIIRTTACDFSAH
jgi:hypothetical protein